MPETQDALTLNDFDLSRRVIVSGVGMCGAGGSGSTTGSLMHSDVYLSAPLGYFLDQTSLVLAKREQPTGWEYGLATDPTWSWSSIPEGASFPNTLIGHPNGWEGQNGDTQGRVDFTFELFAYPRRP